jgi:mRNA interferase RelE/StbE
MSVEIEYTNKAVKALKKIEILQAGKIVKKINSYVKQDDFLTKAKKLKPPFDNLYRFRIGDYRAIFDIDKGGNITVLTILDIKHRKDIY